MAAQVTTEAASPFRKLPAEFWQQMEITYAAEHQNFGRILKAFRELQSPAIKQAELAKALGLTQSQISRIESGKSAVTDLSKMRHWAQLICIPSELLWFDLPNSPNVPCTSAFENDRIDDTTDVEGENVDRREFLKAAVAESTLIATATNEPGSTTSHAVTSNDIERLRDWTHNFRRMDNRWGGGHSVNQAAYYLQSDVLPMLRETRVSSTVRRELLVASAQLFQLTGWMYYDTNDRSRGHKALRNAFKLADEANDHALAAEMQAGMSHQASFLRLPDLAQDYAVNARHHAKLSGLASVKSEAAIMEAHALALQGDTRGTIKALSDADELFHQIRKAEIPDWHSYYDHAYLSAKFGHVLRDLGRPDDAEQYARDSLDMSDGYERGRMFNLGLLAGILADQGKLDEAVTHAELALQMATSMRSSRTQRYLSDVAHRLSPYAQEPQVKHYFRQLTRRGIPIQVVA